MDADETRYRMLALDVDGTIAGADHTVTDATRSAIKAAADAGAIVVIATGRMRRSALKYAELCGANGPVISYSGAWTVAADRVSDLHHERIDEDVAGRIVERMRASGAHINLYIDDEIFVESDSEWAKAYAARMSVSLRVVRSLDEVIGHGPTVVMGVNEPAETAELSLGLRDDLGPLAAVNRSSARFCDVASPNAVKDIALRRIAKEMGIPASQALAAGDEENDVAMLRWAGMGVAVENARADALAAADTIVAGPERDGVADLIRDLLRRGKLGA